MPRNGEYELFTFQGHTYCYDDPDQPAIPTPAGMFGWLAAQPRALARPLSLIDDTAWYLTPKCYLMWKLRWGYQ